MSNRKRTTKKRGKGGLIAIIAAFMVIVLIIAWGIVSQITGQVNPLKWFNTTEQTAPADDEPEEPETAVRLTAPRLMAKTTSTENAGIELYALSSPPNSCTDCGSLEIRYISTTSTCTSAGIASYVCDDCLKMYEVNDNARGHSYRFTSQTTAPTCSTAGSAIYTCSRGGCGATETRSVPATGAHSYAWTITTYPVGDGAGEESYKCATCTSVTQTRTIYALPADPEKEGHHFVGWYQNEALTTPYNGDFIYADTKLYAKFEINVHTVTFDSDGGNDVDSITTDWNTSITPVTPEKEGYNFVGWFTSDGVQYEGQPIKADTTLRARWSIIMFTVTFYVEGEIYTTKQVAYGSALASVLDEANRLNLVVMSVCDGNGVYIEDCAAVQITENYSIVVREMQGSEKALNVIKNNLWYIIGGVVAFVVVCCGIGFAVSRKKGKG